MCFLLAHCWFVFLNASSHLCFQFFVTWLTVTYATPPMEERRNKEKKTNFWLEVMGMLAITNILSTSLEDEPKCRGAVGLETVAVYPRLLYTDVLWSAQLCDLGWRGGSMGRASDSRCYDLLFEPRQEHKKNLWVFPSQICCADSLLVCPNPCVYTHA